MAYHVTKTVNTRSRLISEKDKVSTRKVLLIN